MITALSWLWLVLFSGATAQAAAEVSRGPAGDWVETLSIPAESRFADRVRGGKAYLLSEYQIQPAERGWAMYDRVAYKVVDRTGLESAASLEIEFDPEAETVALNRLHIVRNGEIIDLRQTAKIDIARRERDAEKGIFDGRLTAYLTLEDVRVGDIVDWATTVVRRPAVADELIHRAFRVEWNVPVSRFRVKVTVPQDVHLFHTSRETDLKPEIRSNEGVTTYIWDQVDPEPIAEQPNAPPDVAVQGIIELSSTQNWADIVAATKPHYVLTQELPEQFRKRLATIAERNPAPQDRLVEAMRLVQDELRYVSLAMGVGTYIPRSPAEVVRSGFGDCKDKSLLLATALRWLGIDADVALTNSREGLVLPKRLPGISVFDHVIVKARIADRTYWLDPTNYLQGGRADTLVPPPFDFALPLAEGASALEAIPRPQPADPAASIHETFDFPTSDNDPLKLTVLSVYRAESADSMRYRFKNESAAKLSNDYVAYYNGQYPGIHSVAPLEFSDDRELNIIRVTERYELDAADLIADDLIKDFPLKADFALGEFPTPSRVGRTAPVWLGRPVFKQHIALVRNLKARFSPPDETKPNFATFGALTALTEATDTSFQVVWTFMTFTDRIPPGYLKTYSKTLDDFWRDSKWSFDFSYVAKASD
ncbi:MAG: DUF3857 domain-containing transglutaminase family protein [Pseudomonadota bacterium]